MKRDFNNVENRTNNKYNGGFSMMREVSSNVENNKNNGGINMENEKSLRTISSEEVGLRIKERTNNTLNRWRQSLSFDDGSKVFEQEKHRVEKAIRKAERKLPNWIMGKKWTPARDVLIMPRVKELIDDSSTKLATRNRYIKRVQKLQLRKNRRTMIEDAKSVYPVPHSVFDRNTDLFNCQNGTLNLTTGEFRPHDPADFLTLMSGITYDPEASCPRWTQFISEVMMNDSDLAAYLQKSLGYALTGDTSLECLFIL